MNTFTDDVFKSMTKTSDFERFNNTLGAMISSLISSKATNTYVKEISLNFSLWNSLPCTRLLGLDFLSKVHDK